jgi:hypothetical protein
LVGEAPRRISSRWRYVVHNGHAAPSHRWAAEKTPGRLASQGAAISAVEVQFVEPERTAGKELDYRKLSWQAILLLPELELRQIEIADRKKVPSAAVLIARPGPGSASAMIGRGSAIACLCCQDRMPGSEYCSHLIPFHAF